MDAYYIQRRSLERQQLSEEILPPSELNSIIQTAAKSKFVAERPEENFTTCRTMLRFACYVGFFLFKATIQR